MLFLVVCCVPTYTVLPEKKMKVCLKFLVNGSWQDCIVLWAEPPTTSRNHLVQPHSDQWVRTARERMKSQVRRLIPVGT